MLKRQEDKSTDLEMDDQQLKHRLQSSGLYDPNEDSIQGHRTGKLEEQPSSEEKATPFTWEGNASQSEFAQTPAEEGPVDEQEKQATFDGIVEDWFDQDSGEEPVDDTPVVPQAGSQDIQTEQPAGEPAFKEDYYWGDETPNQEEKAKELDDWFSTLDPDEPTTQTVEAIPARDEETIPPAAEVETGEASPERLRPIALEDYEPPPAPEPVEPNALEEVGTKVTGFWRSQSTLTRIVIILLSVFMFGLAVSIPLFNFLANRSQPAAQAAVATIAFDESGQPYPIGLRITGGWFFNLQPSHIEDGVWKPEGPEWLKGTEVRKVLTIPWSRQSEAVIRSLAPGDSLQLHMSDNYIQEYQVDSIEQVNRSDVYMYSNNDASLVIILYQADSNDRWVAISHLVESKK